MVIHFILDFCKNIQNILNLFGISQIEILTLFPSSVDRGLFSVLRCLHSLNCCVITYWKSDEKITKKIIFLVKKAKFYTRKYKSLRDKARIQVRMRQTTEIAAIASGVNLIPKSVFGLKIKDRCSLIFLYNNIYINVLIFRISRLELNSSVGARFSV